MNPVFCTFIYLSSILYRYAPHKLIFAKIRKGSNSVITCDRVTILALCTFSDSLLSIHQVSFNSLIYFYRYALNKFFIAKIKKQSNSVNTADWVTILTLYTSPDHHLSVYQVSLNYAGPRSTVCRAPDS